MTATLPKIIADFNTTITASVAVGATSFTLTSATDDDGVALPTGTYGLTIDRKNSNKEYIQCTITGTAVTNVKHVSRQGTLTNGFANAHRKGAEVIISDFSVLKKMLDLLDGTTRFDSGVTIGYDGTATISDATDLATKAYVDATATGTTNVNRIIVSGNAGETVSAGQLLYLDVADGEWKKCDADTAATVDNINLGIAQGAGTDGNSITGGVLTYGIDTNQTGLTANNVYYASNTAGGISNTPGTTEVTIGYSVSTTSIFFDPRYNQQITENEQDALVGTSGTPSSTNKYVTANDESRNYNTVGYAADAGGTDAYAITLSPTPTAYTNGMVVKFKANTANTGAATLNVNSLGALSIVKGLSTPLETGDILANQICEVIYNSTGTVWQLVNPSSITNVNTVIDTVELLQGVGYSTTIKDYWNFTIPFLVSTDIPTGNVWTLGVNSSFTRNSIMSSTQLTLDADNNSSTLTTNAIFVDYSTQDWITFDSTKKIIVEFGVKLNGSGTEQQGFGLTSGGVTFYDYDDQTVDAVAFTISSAGSLYAKTSNAGVGHTETQITGITLTDMNTYRIEFDPGVDAKFYVNGVLKQTLTTNLPDGNNQIKFGYGFGGNSGNNHAMYLTAPNFAIEK